MARQQVQYVRYYAIGSAARKVELPAKTEVQPKPKVKKARLPILRLDGLSVVGIVVAAVMLVCMLIGLVRVNQANTELQQMQSYIAQLNAQNELLRDQYEHGYNLNEVRVAAESMGLVPRAQVEHITITLPEPVVEEEPTWWESFVENIRFMFA